MSEENIMQTVEAATVFDIYKAGQEDERAKIVAWLRGFRWFSTAAAIEAGEHLK